MIILRSHIGWPSPKYTDTEHAHGNPLGEDEVRVVKEILGLPPNETFYVPEDVLSLYRDAGVRGRPGREEWEKRLASLHIDRAAWDACLAGSGINGWEGKLPTWSVGDKLATRRANGACIQALVDVVPGLMAGGADLTGNTGTVIKDHGVQSAAEPGGRQIYFGVREHGMATAMNGMAMHGGVLPAGGTFFTFSDYMRGGVRLSALQQAKVVFVWTHDSVGLGEDGPTHQPIEQLAAVRAMPGLRVIRPSDANETAVAWQVVGREQRPDGSCPHSPGRPGRGHAGAGARAAAGRVCRDRQRRRRRSAGGLGPDADRHRIRAVGVSRREAAARSRRVARPGRVDAVLDTVRSARRRRAGRGAPADVPTLAVEAATSFGWDRWADDSVSIDRFGASAPGKVALEKLGFTPENVADRARRLLAELEEED